MGELQRRWCQFLSDLALYVGGKPQKELSDGTSSNEHRDASLPQVRR
jgi:hypothetical protein